MRISETEKQMFVVTTHECFGKTAQIWLFGSRVDDQKRGGDIDLYIETDLTEGIVQAKLDFRAKIFPVFGDQKIDVIVHRRHLKIQAIHEIAKEKGILLT